jgi:hypothetical protein
LECVDSYHIQVNKYIVDIRKALNRFTSEMNNTSLKTNLSFTHDLVDLFRQTFQNLEDDSYVEIVKLYPEKDLNAFMETGP